MEKRTGKAYWELDDEDYTRVDKFVTETLCDFWQSVLNSSINKYLDNKQRKITVKIDRWDCYSMDHTLSLIILPMLKQLKATKHGSPSIDDADVPAELQSSNAPPKENDWDTDELWHKRWEWVIDELIWTFTQMTDEDNDSQFHSGKSDIVWNPVDKDGNTVPKDGAKWYQLGSGPEDTHVYDRAGSDAHQKRINNGLGLFGRYFRGLWD
jgi:hypothetical protein